MGRLYTQLISGFLLISGMCICIDVVIFLNALLYLKSKMSINFCPQDAVNPVLMIGKPMPKQKRTIIEGYKMVGINNGDFNPLIKSTDYILGEEIRGRIANGRMVNFHPEEPAKTVLEITTDKGTFDFVLNATNSKFLSEQGFNDTDQLIGKTLVIKKENRMYERNGTKSEIIGMFIKEVTE